MSTVKARSKPYAHMPFPGRWRSPSSTYLCERCGIEKQTGGGGAPRGRLCADCRMVDPRFGERR